MEALLAGAARLLDAALAVQGGGASLLEALLHPESGQPGMWSRAARAAGTSLWLDKPSWTFVLVLRDALSLDAPPKPGSKPKRAPVVSWPSSPSKLRAGRLAARLWSACRERAAPQRALLGLRGEIADLLSQEQAGYPTWSAFTLLVMQPAAEAAEALVAETAAEQAMRWLAGPRARLARTCRDEITSWMTRSRSQAAQEDVGWTLSLRGAVLRELVRAEAQYEELKLAADGLRAALGVPTAPCHPWYRDKQLILSWLRSFGGYCSA